MKHIVIVVGSARRGRVADTILDYTKEAIAHRSDITATVADLKEIDLPFFDEDYSPADPRFSTNNEAAQAWTKMVADADGVLFLTPEYNHQLSAIMKNAVDWIYAEWKDKPTAAIAYGWGGGALALKQLEKLLEKVEARYVGTPTSLYFTKHIDTDGSALTPEDNQAAIQATLDALVA